MYNIKKNVLKEQHEAKCIIKWYISSAIEMEQIHTQFVNFLLCMPVRCGNHLDVHFFFLPIIIKLTKPIINSLRFAILNRIAIEMYLLSDNISIRMYRVMRLM